MLVSVIMRFTCFITDLDGTLVKLNIDWEKLRMEIRELLKTDHPLRPLATSIPIAAKGNTELINKAFEYVKHIELQAANNVNRDTELINFFEWLVRNKIKIGLVTLQAKEPALLVLDKLGILNFLSLVITREDSLHRIDQLSLALKILNAEPNNTIFVGDTQWDVDAGKKLGCYTVSVNHNVMGADLYIKKIPELQQILRSYL